MVDRSLPKNNKAKCGKPVDKYIEHDRVIVSLDAILLKRGAFRHILINSGIKSHWKFCLVLLICDAVTRLLRPSTHNVEKAWPQDNVLYSALEIDLYWNFCLAAIDMFTFLVVVVTLMSVFKMFSKEKHDWPSFKDCMCGLMLSMFGKMFVLPALLWAHKYSAVYTWLSYLFTAAANVQALTVLCPKWHSLGMAISVVLGQCASIGVSKVLQNI
ncbi:protein ARV1-like isoform X2 [Dreissena polymorpha]|uniref:protein ARV1-like isoform X2 n=1 Tax=Dreissena polymorpha TaxID=45954 RepID=UPI002264D427|nr:protein ARV1-like isoform X2 [Dreissena polymorpha]